MPLALPRFGAIELLAYSPQAARSLVGLSDQDDQDYIWATQLPSQYRSSELRRLPYVGLLLRTPPKADCARGEDPVVDFVNRCMPTWLSSRSYVVVAVLGEGTRWVFAVLKRESMAAASGFDDRRND